MNLKPDQVRDLIFYVRGEQVILDFHLAVLYQVETRTLKQAVRRNKQRFPRDFMFQLTKKEFREVITNCDNLPKNLKYSPTTPFAFTEQGVAMLSSVLRSERAVQANVSIIRAFVKMRRLVSEHESLRKHIEALESKYDAQFKVVFEAIKQLITERSKPRRMIGFKRKPDE